MKVLWGFARSMIVLGCLLMALMAVYMGWINGAFDKAGFFGVPYTVSERALGWLYVVSGLALTVLGGLMFVKHIGRLVLAAVGLMTMVLVVFTVNNGWGEDLLIVVPLYPLMIGGYYLAQWAGSKRLPE